MSKICFNIIYNKRPLSKVDWPYNYAQRILTLHISMKNSCFVSEMLITAKALLNLFLNFKTLFFPLVL